VPSYPITGGVFEYEVQPGDFLTKIGARFGIAEEVLVRENNLKYNAMLKPGQKLTIDNRHIVPDLLGMACSSTCRSACSISFATGAWWLPIRWDWVSRAGQLLRASFSVNNKVANKTCLCQNPFRRRCSGKVSW